MRYVVTKGPDNVSWLSLEPFLEDLKESVIHLMELELPDNEEQQRNIKLHGLQATYDLLSTIVHEANLKAKLNETVQTTH